MRWHYAFLTLTCLFWPAMATAQVNLDPVAASNTMEVKRLVISGENLYEHGSLDFDDLLREANQLRTGYPREMTFEQIARIGDLLTQKVREAGYKFHYIYLPKQNARSGTVRLNLVEVTLDAVVVNGDESLSRTRINQLFNPYRGQPLYQPHIDRALRALEAQPDMQLYAYYSRGAAPNSVILNIRLQRRPRHLLSLSADNFGSEASGLYRSMMNYQWLSPLGQFDRLNVNLMYADGGAGNLYGLISYQTPLLSVNNSLSFTLSNNQYEVGREFSQLELKGDALIAGLNFTQRAYPTNNSKHQWYLSAFDKRIDYSNVFNDDSLVNDEQARVFGLGWQHQFTSEGGRYQANTDINGRTGNHQLTGATEYDDQFALASISHSSRFYPGNQQLRASISVQYSDKLLPSFEKMPLTGINGVKGFYAGQVSADRGASVNLYWQLPALWRADGGGFWLFGYADFATGERLDFEGAQIDKATLGGAGLGAQLILANAFFARLHLSAWTHAEMDQSLPPTELPLTFDLQYRW